MKPLKLALCLLLCLEVTSITCGGNNAVCGPGSSCLYQPGVDSCMYQVNSEPLGFSITDDFSYFNWVPTNQEYIFVTVSFCSLNADSSKNYYVSFYIQDKDGTGHPSAPIYNFPVSYGCTHYSFESAHFCTKPQGGYCNLLVSMAISSGSATVKISVEGMVGTVKYIIPILIAIGAAMLITVVVLVVCIIRRRITRARILLEESMPKSISHFDRLIPKMKHKDCLNRGQSEMDNNCSVCLMQMDAEQMVRRSPCGHIFHADCVDEWCKVKLICPMCREPLDENAILKRTNNEGSRMELNAYPSVDVEDENIENVDVNT